jgi:hypothetical protein
MENVNLDSLLKINGNTDDIWVIHGAASLTCGSHVPILIYITDIAVDDNRFRLFSLKDDIKRRWRRVRSSK